MSERPLPVSLAAGETGRPLRLVRLELELGWENAPYNQFSLPLADAREITFVTYFPSPIQVDPRVRLEDGGGSLRGYWRALRRAVSREHDLVHAHTPHVGLFYLLFRRWLGGRRVPRVFTVHNSFPNFRFRNKLLLLPVFAGFDRVVCCGEASRASFPALYRGLAGKRLTAVPNGVDLARVDRTLRGVTATEGPGLRVVSVGRLIPIKNTDVLLRAFVRGAGANASLRVIGDGAQRDDLERYAAELPEGERIRFLGRISRDRVFQEAAQADLYVSTSLGEGLPVAVLEAMACRCPVLLSDIPPHREIAEGAPFIPLVDPRDQAGWERELVRFAAMSPEQRRELGRSCREHLEKNFSLVGMLSRYERLYEQVVREREARRGEL